MSEDVKRFRGPEVTTGVRSSFDIPPERIVLDNAEHPNLDDAPVVDEGYPGVEFSVERTLKGRIAELERKVELLWDQIMDKPISLKEDEG